MYKRQVVLVDHLPTVVVAVVLVKEVMLVEPTMVRVVME